MLINKNTYGYSRNKKHITGRGFVDSLSSIFNSLKASVAPTIRSIGSYVSTNRDLIAKPVLGAIGSLAATGLTAGVPAILSHIANRHSRPATSQLSDPKILDDPKYKEILQTIMTPSQATPVSNIIGTGVRPRGAGIKTF
jgi:hypothetical protein